ncbi:MAG: glycerol-3-phosphate 1-O-acyltransferase PlsY [Endomicrobium sp.]|jgi:glycerol-3-phosphate acyltransferase PlsY|nr:glycerol-3-phosphate 1-O-acyltransferase PlsY [Endomicrobium sp.]
MLIKILYVILAYLCGSIPFAYIIAKVVGKIDIREFGSGNSGATNIFRALGKGPAILTFIADTLKGFVPVYFAKFIDERSFYILIVATGMIIGHIFTVFLKFKGGKGIAVGGGALLAFMPPIGSLIIYLIFVLVFVSSGYVSLGSICAALIFPLVSYFLGYTELKCVIFTFIIALLIVYAHRTNIKRLKEGCENRFEIFKKKKSR